LDWIPLTLDLICIILWQFYILRPGPMTPWSHIVLRQWLENVYASIIGIENIYAPYPIFWLLASGSPVSFEGHPPYLTAFTPCFGGPFPHRLTIVNLWCISAIRCAPNLIHQEVTVISLTFLTYFIMSIWTRYIILVALALISINSIIIWCHFFHTSWVKLQILTKKPTRINSLILHV